LSINANKGWKLLGGEKKHTSEIGVGKREQDSTKVATLKKGEKSRKGLLCLTKSTWVEKREK